MIIIAIITGLEGSFGRKFYDSVFRDIILIMSGILPRRRREEQQWGHGGEGGGGEGTGVEERVAGG